MALAESPDDPEVECPYCTTLSKFEPLGGGRTTRLLPYFELESNLQQIAQNPPGGSATFRRLVRGQTVIFCEEMNILHFATVGDIWTNARNISPEGMPSISFMIRGLDTGPIPHVSGAEDRHPPFWCLPEELRQAAKESAESLEKPLTAEEKKAAAQAKRAATLAAKKAAKAN